MFLRSCTCAQHCVRTTVFFAVWAKYWAAAQRKFCSLFGSQDYIHSHIIRSLRLYVCHSLSILHWLELFVLSWRWHRYILAGLFVLRMQNARHSYRLYYQWGLYMIYCIKTMFNCVQNSKVSKISDRKC